MFAFVIITVMVDIINVNGAVLPVVVAMDIVSIPVKNATICIALAAALRKSEQQKII